MYFFGGETWHSGGGSHDFEKILVIFCPKHLFEESPIFHRKNFDFIRNHHQDWYGYLKLSRLQLYRAVPYFHCLKPQPSRFSSSYMLLYIMRVLSQHYPNVWWYKSWVYCIYTCFLMFIWFINLPNMMLGQPNGVRTTTPQTVGAFCYDSTPCMPISQWLMGDES